MESSCSGFHRLPRERHRTDSCRDRERVEVREPGGIPLCHLPCVTWASYLLYCPEGPGSHLPLNSACHTAVCPRGGWADELANLLHHLPGFRVTIPFLLPLPPKFSPFSPGKVSIFSLPLSFQVWNTKNWHNNSASGVINPFAILDTGYLEWLRQHRSNDKGWGENSVVEEMREVACFCRGDCLVRKCLCWPETGFPIAGIYCPSWLLLSHLLWPWTRQLGRVRGQGHRD